MSLLRRIAFPTGVVALFAAVSPPMERAVQAKLSMHMLQHLVLILVVPPLLVAGRPVLRASLALPLGLRRGLRRIVAKRPSRRMLHVAIHPAFVGVSYAAVLWGWHMPRAYELALRSDIAHLAEHASFLGVALLFWYDVLSVGRTRRTGYGSVLALVFGTMLHSAWLAMILSFSPRVVYPVYAGPGALADQQLAGVLMWIPMALASALVMGVIFMRWLRRMDARWRSREDDLPSRVLWGAER